jgi:putative chitinase
MTLTIPFLTEENLKACITENPKISAWFPVFQDYLVKHDIDTVNRVAGFLSQTAYESAYWTKFSENLNYSAGRLLVVFPKYFKSKVEAARYDRQPEKIANHVYANRIGNGDEASGDGWKYRGRGAIQCTGKANYAECSEWMFGFKDALLREPEMLAKTDGVIMSAIWYWETRGLNKLADAGDVAGMTKRINGGTHGLAVRAKLYDRMHRVLS